MLQEKLDLLKSAFEGGQTSLKPSPSDLGLMRQATKELMTSGAATRALQAGQAAPVFVLPDAYGQAISLLDLLRHGPLVISFYRGVWCPYCNLELQALEEALLAFTERGARLVAISPQTPANNRKSMRDNELTFPILSDAKSEVADAFGIRFALPSYLVELHQRFGNQLDISNDDPAWVLPMPARYVVGQDGTILYAEINPDYTRRPEPSDLLTVLEHAGRFASAN